MFEYTNAFIQPFTWARRAYEYTLGLSRETAINVTESDLIRPIADSLSTADLIVDSDTVWNTQSRAQVATVGGLYKSVDTGGEYLNSLRTQLASRISESEKRVQEVEGGLRTLITSGRRDSTTSITIRGGDTSWVETDDLYYKDYGPLDRVGDEGIFRLPDAGYFSSIRSLGGFAGRAVVERSLGQLVTDGDRKSTRLNSSHVSESRMPSSA